MIHLTRDTRRQLLRFGVVGSVGFVVDAGILWIAITAGASPLLARVLSFPMAVLATWALNRAWTFDQADRARPAAQLQRYVTVQLGGAACNFAIYALVLTLAEPTRCTALIGLALGSAGGMVINYLGARKFVFRP